jgi:hypothetical protein
VPLMGDETILRLSPVPRRAWSLRGAPAEVPVTGRDAERVPFAALDSHTGRRICRRGSGMRQGNFHALLRGMRRR